MCGIVGYNGLKKAGKIIFNGLKRLEYRGYDSFGISVVNDDNFSIIKKASKISESVDNSILEELNGQIGIGHTRWATHGKPNEANAHPHFDDIGLSIVHNGIIENYSSLKKMLIDNGYNFFSETDSEVIVHLISYFLKKQNLNKKLSDISLEEIQKSFLSALNLLEGTFGLVLMSKFHDDAFFVARRGSPLVIGVGEGEMFIASDVSAILEYTRKVVYLDDNEIGIIFKDKYEIKNFNGISLSKEVDVVRWNIEQIEKKGYKHFMLKEIFEQPEAIKNTLRGRIFDDKIKLDLEIDVSSIKRIIISACGTSWHSALIGKFYIEKFSKIPVEVDYASEFRYRDPLVNSDDLMVVISQSGETADTLAALREAKLKGAKTFGIVNVVGSTISREVDHCIFLHAGPEIGVASTKAFTTQVIDLLLFSLYLAQKKNLEYNKKILKELSNLSNIVDEILKNSSCIEKLSDEFKDFKNILYLGRGYNFPCALEGALKLKEISYIHAEGYPAAEMKHGPIALVDENMPVFFIATNDTIFEKVVSNMQEVKARGGNIISIINYGDKRLSELTSKCIEVPLVDEVLSPIVNIISMQLFSYYIADKKDINVDKPRNLAKSVTVE